MVGPEERKVPGELKGADANEQKASSETVGDKQKTGEKSVTRRELLATAGTLGVAMAADALLSNPAVAAATGAAAPANEALKDGGFYLPLNLDTTRNFETMLRALEDPKVRKGLAKQKAGLPQGVKELVVMLDDAKFKKLADDAVAKYNSMMLGDLGQQEVVKVAGKELYEFMSTNYPSGFEMLRTYAANAGDIRAMGVAVNAEAAANAYAVVNAVVWANVAAATMAVVVAVVFVAM